MYVVFRFLFFGAWPVLGSLKWAPISCRRLSLLLLLLLNVIVSLQYIIVEAPIPRTCDLAAEVLQEFSKVGLLST